MEDKTRLLLYIMFLQAMDIFTTYIAIYCGARELNPVVYYLLDKPLLLFIMKVLVGLAVYIIANGKKTVLLIYTLIMLQAIILNTCNIVTCLME